MNIPSVCEILSPTPAVLPLSTAVNTYTCSGSSESDAAIAYGCVDWFIYPDSQLDPVRLTTTTSGWTAGSSPAD